MNSDRRTEPGEQATRERLLGLLRRGPCTADELATVVGLTANAVRQHLAHLERDRAITRCGTRHSGAAGKPAVLYEASAEREVGFSRAYAPVLRALLSVLPQHVSAAAMKKLWSDTADRLSVDLPTARGDFEQRVRAGAEVLNALGAVTEITEDASGARITGYSCPLAEAVAVRPELCTMLAQALHEITGLAVRDCCDHNGKPRCQFQLTETRGAVGRKTKGAA
jgi:predicted ArsR family transcriptional regulator